MRQIRRVAMLSAHTSPLEQPGGGDAGGMNVYVLELAQRLARRGIDVDIFTRATSRHLPQVAQASQAVTVHHVAAGPFEGLGKNDLPAQLCSFVRDVLRAEVEAGPGYFDIIHSHYWLSGQVGTVARERWDVPLVHTMHTMAKVKNASLAAGDSAEPIGRIVGEEEIVRLADRLVANTEAERGELIDLYDADPQRVSVVPPGVDTVTFTPASSATEAREQFGIRSDAIVVMFAGRIQPLKAPDVLVEAAAVMIQRRPELAGRLVVPIVGAASGSGLDEPDALARLVCDRGLSDVVRFEPPVAQAELANWYRAADVVCVPSYNESFGLVALEAQACGTPVIAANVGGLSTAVADGVSGILIDGHDPADYAEVMLGLIDDPRRLADLGRKAVEHAAAFSWDATVDRTLQVYQQAVGEHQQHHDAHMVRTTR